MKRTQIHSKRELFKVNGNLNEMVTVHDEHGNILHRITNPIMLEFQDKDVIQIIVGATLLAIPVAFTEETWKLGETIPLLNALILMLISLGFLGIFIYYNYYRKDYDSHKSHFFLRLMSTYALSFLVVAVVLTLIQQTTWFTDIVLTFKRIVIITLPASMSAAVADFLK